MLVRFAASNILSINERQELSLVPSAYLKDRQALLISATAVPSGTLLPSAVIYGPNASGKTNILAAANFLCREVEQSHGQREPQSGVDRRCFALAPNCAGKPTILEIEFTIGPSRYQYGFEANDEAYVGEWLYLIRNGRRQFLFERSSARRIKFGRKLKGQNRVISELMRPNSLFLSVAAQNKHEQCTPIYEYITSFAFQHTSADPGGFIGTKKKTIDLRVISFLKQINTGVIGFRTKQAFRESGPFIKDVVALVKRHMDSEKDIQIADDAFKDMVEIELAHEVQEGQPVYFDLRVESAGTRRLLYILASVYRAIDNGTVLFIDELDASLHTQIGEAILGLFADRKLNRKGAQLIATTHDTNLMLSESLRRDQLWFTEKDALGATHLYPLTDIRTRRTDNIEKGYLEGRYGAIPFADSLTALLKE